MQDECLAWKPLERVGHEFCSVFSGRDAAEFFFPVTPWMMSRAFPEDPFLTWRITTVQVRVTPTTLSINHAYEVSFHGAQEIAHLDWTTLFRSAFSETGEYFPHGNPTPLNLVETRFEASQPADSSFSSLAARRRRLTTHFIDVSFPFLSLKALPKRLCVCCASATILF